MFSNHPPQTNKASQLNEKMLEIAEDLLLEELANDSLFACGADLTSKVVGAYGLYETFNGELISFQPKATLNFTLICEKFIVKGDMATIMAIIPRLNHYELAINQK